MDHRSAAATSCPVSLDLLALLLRCDEVRLAATLGALPERQRAALALYCFDRYHMRRLGLAVARHCSGSALEAVDDGVGRNVFELAGNATSPDRRERQPQAHERAPAREAA